MLTNIPEAFQSNSTWIAAALIGGFLLFVWHVFDVGGRLTAFGKRFLHKTPVRRGAPKRTKPQKSILPWIRMTAVTSVLVASAYGWNEYQVAQCRPGFAWLPNEPERGQYGGLDKPYPYKTVFARVVPESDRRYYMKIFGDSDENDNLKGLSIRRVVRMDVPPDPSPWQLRPSGIGYRANYPVGEIGILIVAIDPDKVILTKPQFGCL